MRSSLNLVPIKLSSSCAWELRKSGFSCCLLILSCAACLPHCHFEARLDLLAADLLPKLNGRVGKSGFEMMWLEYELTLPLCWCQLVCACARNVERHHQGGGEDSEARYHVPRILPGGGSDYEETPPRQAGAALRRGVGGAHLHRHRVHGPR